MIQQIRCPENKGHLRAYLDWSFSIGISKEWDSFILLTSPCVWNGGIRHPFPLERLPFLCKVEEIKHPPRSVGKFPAREGWTYDLANSNWEASLAVPCLLASSFPIASGANGRPLRASSSFPRLVVQRQCRRRHHTAHGQARRNSAMTTAHRQQPSLTRKRIKVREMQERSSNLWRERIRNEH